MYRCTEIIYQTAFDKIMTFQQHVGKRILKMKKKFQVTEVNQKISFPSLTVSKVGHGLFKIQNGV